MTDRLAEIKAWRARPAPIGVSDNLSLKDIDWLITEVENQRSELVGIWESNDLKAKEIERLEASNIKAIEFYEAQAIHLYEQCRLFEQALDRSGDPRAKALIDFIKWTKCEHRNEIEILVAANKSFQDAFEKASTGANQ